MSPKTSHPADATDHNKLQDASHAQGWSPIRWRASWIASFVGGRVQRIQPTRPPGLDIIYCNQNNSPQGIGTNLSEPAASTIRGDFVGRCRRWCRICRHHGSRQIKKGGEATPRPPKSRRRIPKWVRRLAIAGRHTLREVVNIKQLQEKNQSG